MQKLKIKDQNLDKNQLGFTLVELLVSVTLFAIVIVLGTTALLSIMKSNNKAKMINRLRNDGSRVIEEIEREIKAADEVQVATQNNLDYRKNGNEYYRYSIVDGGSGNNYIKKMQCTGMGTCATDLYTLTPTNNENGINVVLPPSSSFTYYDFGEVKITLVFEQPVGVPDRADYQGSVTLNSSVTLRDY